MAASDTVICNMALSHLGSASPITDMDDDSAEARVCLTFYETARKKFLEDCRFAVNDRVETLSLIEEDPTEEWAYSYGYPSDCLFLKRIQSGVRSETRDSAVAFKIGYKDGVKVIFTDMDEPIAEYTAFIDESFQSANMDLALSYLLASYIAPRLNNSLPSKAISGMLELYRMHVQQALANAGNEQMPDAAPEAEWVRGR